MQIKWHSPRSDRWFTTTPMLSLCRNKSPVLFSALSEWGTPCLWRHMQQGPTWKTHVKGIIISASQISFLQNESLVPCSHHLETGQREKQTVLPRLLCYLRCAQLSNSKRRLFLEASPCMSIWTWCFCCGSKALAYRAECSRLPLPPRRGRHRAASSHCCIFFFKFHSWAQWAASHHVCLRDSQSCFCSLKM